MSRRSDRPQVFDAATFDAVELVAADIPALQKLFDDNPEYFLAVTGSPPRSNEGLEKWMCGEKFQTQALARLSRDKRPEKRTK